MSHNWKRAKPEINATGVREAEDRDRWLIFVYSQVALFSLKMSRATSTAGKTLLVPTPYSVKMAFLDVALRHRLTADADAVVKELAKVPVRIGVPEHACVTGTIQTVLQESREEDRKRNPALPLYRPSIAMREFVHYEGSISLAFDSHRCSPDFNSLLLRAGPAINYLGKRGSFVQYRGYLKQPELDHTFTIPSKDGGTVPGQIATLDDFGPGASFDALNSFTSIEMQRGVHRKFVDTTIPLTIHNAGAGFVHYSTWSRE